MYSDLKELIRGSWMLTGILQALKDPAKTIESLGPPLLATHSPELQDLQAMCYLISH